MFRLPVFALALFFLISANAFPANPPNQVTRTGYVNWLRSINSNVSAFTDKMFAWYEEQLRSPLPAQVNSDPEKLYVSVDRPLRETIQLEANGEIEEGNTVGFEAYGIIDVPVQLALETKLFYWGKPVGSHEGETFPFDTVFGSIHSWIREKWGPGNHFSSTHQTRGGIVQSLYDDYTVLVRGNASDGFTVFTTFYGPNGDTATLAHISIVMLKSLPNGKTEFRQSVRQNGQSYKIFGLDYGRRNFGFNVARVRQGEKALAATMIELRDTGRIRENRQ